MQKETSTKPFFARLLEAQREQREDLNIIKPDQTMKYPSDGDEW